jgi:glycerol-1-phosphate dehydrogenase [NAD(P)+]
VATPLIVDIRPGAIQHLPHILADGRIATTGKVAVAIGAGVGESVALAIEDILPGVPVFPVVSGSLASARELGAALRSTSIDALVGIGGGGTIDVAKYAAGLVGLPFVSVATTLTHDGLASPVAVLEADGHKGSYGVHAPIAVIVDLDYVAAGPLRHVQSGIGDAVSNLSAIRDWQLAQAVRGEAIDGLAVTMARTAGAAVLHSPQPTASIEFLSTLADSLVLSGIAMTVAGNSRPCSGAEHEISHAINALYPNDRLHGETVAVGTLFASYLRQDPDLPTIDRCFRDRGLARLPEDVGLDDARFTAAVLAAPATRPGRFTILEHLDLDESAVVGRLAAFRREYS